VKIYNILLSIIIFLRSITKLVLIIILLFTLFIPFIILRLIKVKVYKDIPRYFHLLFLKILNIKIQLIGEIYTAKPGLLVSNHASWIDISILSSLTNISFIAKSEVSSWPIFGFLAKMQDTLFIERKSIKASKQKNEIKDILSKGKRLVLFPEGTSSDGNRVLNFKSSLFSVAECDSNIEDVYAIQAITICYKGLNGLPMSRSERPYLSWWGDMGLISHLWNMLSFKSADIIVIAHEPIDNKFNRKIISNIAWKQISCGLGLALSGRAKSLKQNDTLFEIL
jgi:1-acyl-sn-glycerol-3-phosphate acyltransferase